MHILVAIDSFKGTLSSKQAGEAVARGLSASLTGATIRVVPVSDGGDGFIEAFHASLGGRLVTIPCRDPLGRTVQASQLRLPADSRWDCVVEMATSSGLVLLAPREMDVMRGTTWGVGEQLRAALDGGATSILVGAGGSATCDGGAGMLQALGMRLLDGDGRDVQTGGMALADIVSLDASRFDPRLSRTRIIVASDVDNPVVGPYGAARTFAPQKGASARQVEELEAGMVSFAQVLRRDMGTDVSDLAGGGAAGGLAAALVACCTARISPGFDVVSGALSLEMMVQDADLVVTGEGSMDAQTLRGKLPMGMAGLCEAHGKPVVAYCGRLRDPDGSLVPGRFARIWDLESAAGGVQEAMREGGQLLEKVVRHTAPELAGLPAG